MGVATTARVGGATLATANIGRGAGRRWGEVLGLVPGEAPAKSWFSAVWMDAWLGEDRLGGGWATAAGAAAALTLGVAASLGARVGAAEGSRLGGMGGGGGGPAPVEVGAAIVTGGGGTPLVGSATGRGRGGGGGGARTTGGAGAATRETESLELDRISLGLLLCGGGGGLAPPELGIWKVTVFSDPLAAETCAGKGGGGGGPAPSTGGKGTGGRSKGRSKETVDDMEVDLEVSDALLGQAEARDGAEGARALGIVGMGGGGGMPPAIMGGGGGGPPIPGALRPGMGGGGGGGPPIPGGGGGGMLPPIPSPGACSVLGGPPKLSLAASCCLRSWLMAVLLVALLLDDPVDVWLVVLGPRLANSCSRCALRSAGSELGASPSRA